VGFVLARGATVGDAAALAEVSVRAWQETYRGLIPQDYLDGLELAAKQKAWARRIKDDRPPDCTFVVERERGAVVGFIHVGPSRDLDGSDAGEVTAIYLLPGHWGRGAGRILMDAGLRHLVDAGYRRMTLWVLDSNERALRFYEAGGWRPDGVVKTDDSRGFPLVEVRYHIDRGSL
jgi:ribosomal protein S18 acetylase RimI-like enzyme